MAHQIETHGARAAALFARTDPWHRLGTYLRRERARAPCDRRSHGGSLRNVEHGLSGGLSLTW